MNIFIAVTSYEGKIMTGCADALIKNILTLKNAGHEVFTYFHSGDCYIARARNFCARIFLETKCTDMVFIDCDVAFEDDAILKLLKHDKEVVAGVYPYRTDDPQILGDKIPFPVTFKFDEKTKNCLDNLTGLASALRIPSGFLRINRSVFEKMIAAEIVKIDNHDLYNFFDQGCVFTNENIWYGEDTAFCRRWTGIGGEIWVEPNLTFRHIGTKEYKNNLHEYLTRGIK